MLHPNQTKVFNDDSRYRVLVAGRKFGKSTLALAELLRAAQDLRTVVYVAPTYKMARKTLWQDHIDKFVPDHCIAKRNKTDLTITLANGHRISLFGAEDPDKLRGQNLDFVVMDEFQDFRTETWEMVIEPNLLTTKGRALFMGTPKGKKNILYAQYAMDSEMYSPYRYTSYDNSLNDKELLEKIKQRLIAEGKQDVWSQEYMAKFTTVAGLIYTNWDRELHVRDDVKIPPNGTFGLSIDRGMENPSAVNFYYIYQVEGDDRIYQYDEIYQAGYTPRELVNAIKSKMGGRNFIWQTCDPSAKDFISVANEQGLSIRPASRETGGSKESWVLSGISKCKEWLAKSPIDGSPKFSVHPRCKNFIEEIEGYIWEEQPSADKNPKDRPRKLLDHAVDAWRYFIISYKHRMSADEMIAQFPDDDRELFKNGFY